MRNIKSYSELITIPTFTGRYEYLRTTSRIGDMTFGGSREINQLLYKSSRWRSFRNGIIIRDNCCDLGIYGREILARATIHHIDPITIEDILSNNPKVFDPDNAITTEDITHKAIHYGNIDLLVKDPIARYANDTCPWKH